MTSQQVKESIAAVDALIDANRRTVMVRLHCDPGCTTRAWQNAWDRCPDLRDAEQKLYRERGNLQLMHDAALTREFRQQQRKIRASGRTA